MNRTRAWLIVLGLAACASESSAPIDTGISIMALSGADQFGLSNTALAQPLRVFVFDPVSKRPVRGAGVTWRTVSGQGAAITPIIATTGADGIASANARLGLLNTPYIFEATTANITGSPARFNARAVLRPTVTSVTPRTARVGDTLTIAGLGFNSDGQQNVAVLFHGLRGNVVSASNTQLRVVVPPCAPSSSMNLVVAFGAVQSAPETIMVTGAPTPLLHLQRGEVRRLTGAADFVCQRIATQPGSAFLVVPQNASDLVGSESLFELTLLLGASATTSSTQLLARAETRDFGAAWEMKLRARERAFPGITAPDLPAAYRMTPPEIGERKQFKVFDRNDRFVTVTAEVKAVSRHAIVYQDVNAPANGFSSAQFQQLGDAFDAPTYEVDVNVFGPPSDIDNNGQIIILLTPIVNELTPRGANGFVAGFFFGCDLQAAARCSGTNSAEMFYLFVPDPTGRHGDARSTAFVMNGSLPVLAHEFQHMISFGARQSLDALWLSEGLAHMAEDLVADEYRNRGDTQNAALFASQNYARATLFLRDTTPASLITEELPGSLEQRGAGWLLVKYLADHYGGNSFLRSLARSSASGVQNITAATGQPWGTIFSDWSVALWADDAPELVGATADERHSFNTINLRTTLVSGGGFALRPTQVGFNLSAPASYLASATLPASTQKFILFDTGLNTAQPIHLSFAGPHGGPFSPGAVPQVTLLRVR